MIGKKISPILDEIEGTLWEFEANIGAKPEYTEDGVRAGIKIFMSVLMDKIWDLQEEEKIDQKTREAMATKAGEDVRQLIRTYTGLDTFDFYK
jgi:hypothetical protein